MGRVRLFLREPLAEGQSVSLTREAAHYLFGVMRMGAGDGLSVFDGVSGEFAATVAEAGKKGGVLEVGARTAPLAVPPDVWLLFAPIRKERTDFIVEKAAEMGVRRVVPVKTEFTNAGRVNRERLEAHAIEAAEQCGGTFVPEVAELRPLAAVLDDWPDGRRLMFCDEARAGEVADLPGAPGSWAVLVGPEGGFSEPERARLRGLPFARAVALGPRILRADTAAVAALTLWQMRFGDWR